VKTKYIFVSGGVISGLGKGITAASLSLLLKSSGYRITPVKCENYLNVDAGTINPIEHGDPFLCEDGTEADMDLGSYEKFLDENLGRKNFITMGKIYQTVIEKERRFEYNGEDVEAIPHITDEIQKRWREAAIQNKADIVVVELGGTAGEYQNIFYYEASRQLWLKNPGDVVHVHVGYMPTPSHLGEPKTKPIQLSVRTLNSMGIQPDFIVARSEKPMDQRRKDRFALFCNVHPDDVVSAPDCDTVYEVPLLLKEQNMHTNILKKLGLPIKKIEMKKWSSFIARVKNIQKSGKKVTLAITGKYFSTGEYQIRDSYAALLDALQHASWYHGVDLETHWVDAEKIELAIKKTTDKKEKYRLIRELIGSVDGIVVPIGWGKRGAEGMIETAGYARDQKIPYLGLCYGMQLACVSFARDVLGWKDAHTTEDDPKTTHPVIHLMSEQKELMKNRAYGGTMRLGSWEAFVKKGTKAWKAYEKHNAFIDPSNGLTSERHRHRYEFNDQYTKDFEKHGLIISARSKSENLVEIIELPDKVHPFYLGTQGHPEYKSRPLSPHPIIIEFIRACLKH
jgi:CTP synthase